MEQGKGIHGAIGAPSEEEPQHPRGAQHPQKKCGRAGKEGSTNGKQSGYDEGIYMVIQQRKKSENMHIRIPL